MTTVLATYAEPTAATHTIGLGTPTAGRDILIIACGSALFPASIGGDWTREVNVVGDNVLAVYRLAGADNPGTIASVDITYTNGSRAMYAVVIEDDITGALTLAEGTSFGAQSRASLTTPAATVAEQDVVLAIAAGARTDGTTLYADDTAWSNSFTIFGDSGGATTTNEGGRLFVGRDTDRALSAETAAVSLDATEAGPYVGGWLAYQSSTTIAGAATLPAVTGAGEISPAGDLAGAATLPAVTGAAVIEDVVRRRASATPVVKAALLAQLQARAANAASPLHGVNVLDRTGITKDDLWTAAGAQEYVALTGATGSVEVVVLNGGNLRFDESTTLTLAIEALGQDTSDTQAVQEDRVNVLLYEVLREVATQKTWLGDYTGAGGEPDLAAFDYVWFTPANWTFQTGPLPGRVQAGAAAVTLEIEVRARRTYP